MNTAPTRVIVTSKDGHQFLVETMDSAVAYERHYAKQHTAAELEKHGDFTRLHDLGEVILSEAEYVEAPRIASPAERRAAFRVIKGGKS